MSESTQQVLPTDPQINRREFLHYIWAASMALLLAETGGGIAWFMSGANRPWKETHITVDVPALLKAGNLPVNYDRKVWLCNTPQGLFAFHDYCPHLGCNVKWSDINNRFECPCHGAKFQADGTYISGPAFRNLDSYSVTAWTSHGTESTPPRGGPINIDGVKAIEVDINIYILGKPHL